MLIHSRDSSLRFVSFLLQFKRGYWMSLRARKKSINAIYKFWWSMIGYCWHNQIRYHILFRLIVVDDGKFLGPLLL